MSQDAELVGGSSENIEPSPLEVAEETLQGWVSQIRGQKTVIPTEGRKKSRWRLARRSLVALVIFIFVVGSCVWTFDYFRTTRTVRGRILDPWQQPLPGLLIFLASDPRIETTTTAQGDFSLGGVPLDAVSLIVVREEAGQEYPVKKSRAASAELGDLVCLVPPLSIRRSPGSGADWPGLQAKP